MLTLKACKRILETEDFSDEEVKQIREYLYILAQIQLEAETTNH